ncbi:metallothionein-like protein 1 isoform X2 [Camellia sinensis]|uniref:metallothionein-like protein 1 isoform X2 n=1 Tax=Camellia sinensis TaxID=4442 RepID=UPI001035F099|nr:metallothionein-like protein 1 isoform X2 [Camellia sinensis]
MNNKIMQVQNVLHYRSAPNPLQMYPDIENTTTTTIIAGVAPPVNMYSEGSEKSFGAEGGHGCKCGSNCKCDPCTC